MRRGITLLEVMIVTLCMAVIIGASTNAVLTAIQHTGRVKASRVVNDRNAIFEDRLRSILQNAYLSSVAADTNSYFLGGQGVVVSPTITNSTDNNQNQLVFTGLSQRIPSELIDSTETFENLNKAFGPEGGMTEYSVSLTPVGQAPVDQALFLRHQTPADGDPSQGGMESVLDPDITSISYEFYNGTDWDTSWDSTTQATPRLPAAVRITYRRKNDSADHIFIVRLIHSDVTPDNPVVTGTTL